MAFCGKCGAELNEGVKFCGGCGAPVGGGQSPAQSSGQGASQANSAAQVRSGGAGVVGLPDKWVWLLSAILGVSAVINFFTAGSILSIVVSVVLLAAQVTFVILDGNEVKKRQINLGVWRWLGCILTFIYVFVRAAKTNKKYAYAITYLVLWVVGMYVNTLGGGGGLLNTGKLTEVPAVLASFESAYSAALAENGSDAVIAKKDLIFVPPKENKWFKYDFVANEDGNIAGYRATALSDIGMFTKGHYLQTVYEDKNSGKYSHCVGGGSLAEAMNKTEAPENIADGEDFNIEDVLGASMGAGLAWGFALQLIPDFFGGGDDILEMMAKCADYDDYVLLDDSKKQQSNTGSAQTAAPTQESNAGSSQGVGSTGKIDSKVANLVPSGYQVFKEIKGDLNKDNSDDYVLMIQGKRNPERVGIIIAFNNGGNYELVLESRNCLSFSYEPEYGDIKTDVNNGVLNIKTGAGGSIDIEAFIKNGVLNIKQSFASGVADANGQSYKFRYQNSDFEMIGYDSYSGGRACHSCDDFSSDTSINILGKKMQTKETVTKVVEGGTKVLDEKWYDIVINAPIKLRNIDRFEKFDVMDYISTK